MTDIASLGLAVDSSGVVRATGDLDKFSAASDKAEKSATGVGTASTSAGRAAAAANDNAASAANRASAAYGKWHATAIRMVGVLGTIAGTLATTAVFRYADAWSDMQSRVGAAIKDMEAAPAMMQRIVDIANASYSPLDQTVEVYARNVAVLRDLGRGATEAADFTESLNHALVITATRGERAASVQNALSKAMAVGRLQADGLETILANGGRVAEALAAQLGTNVNGLRAFASQGKITGDVIASALIGNLSQLREEAAEMPATIGDAFTRLQTNLTAFIGQLDQTTGASQRASAAIMLVADNIDVIARAAAVAGVALALYFGPVVLGQIAFALGYMGAAGVAALNAIRVAVLANPIGALVVAVTTAVTAFYLFRDEIKQAIGIDFVAIIEGAINTVIGVFVGGFDAISATWRQLPAAVGDLAYQAGYALAENIRYWINEALILVGNFISTLNGAMGTSIGTPNLMGPIANNNPYAGAAAGVGQAASAAMSAALARDYVGELKEIVAGTRSAEEATNGMATAMNNAGGVAKAALDKVKDAADKAKGAIESAKEALGQGFGGILEGLINKSISWKDALMQAGQALLKYLNQMNVAQGGKGLFGGGFLQGLLGGLLGFAKGGVFENSTVTAFAKGGIVSKPTVFPFAKGVGLMGEAGPEAIMPLQRGPDGRLGVAAQRDAANDQPIRIMVVSRFDADGGFESAVERTSRPIAKTESAAAAGKVASAVPSMTDARGDERQFRRIRPGGGF